MDKEKLKSGAIVFTDMKDFTSKSSLFTNKQLSTVLDDQEKIVLKNVDKYSGEIIKSMGDGYMIYFEKALDAVKSSIDILNDFKIYNSKKDIDLLKIELRIAMDFGDFIEKQTFSGKDYFGTPINIASRLESLTSVNGVFLTENLFNELGGNHPKFDFLELGTKAFKGIFENIKIYELIFIKEDLELLKKGLLDGEKYNEKFLLDNFGDREKKINDLIFKISSIGAILSTQPIPFLDTYNLLALQVYLLKGISEIYGIKLTTRQSKDVLFTVLGVIGSNYLLGQGIVGISKIGVPFLGGYLVIPLTFGLTYGYGKVLNSYFYYKTFDKKLSNEEINALFIENMAKGKEIGKAKKTEIIKIGKDNKDIFINAIKEIYEKYNLKEFLLKLKLFLKKQKKVLNKYSLKITKTFIKNKKTVKK